MSIQKTFKTFTDKIEARVATKVENKMQRIANYAIYRAVPDQAIDTGAYVTSFSIGMSGFGGGRRRSSENKPTNQNPSQMKDIAFDQLQSDISMIDFEAMIAQRTNFNITLRNRSPHAQEVENGGVTWRKNPNGYGVFAKIYMESRNDNL